ncbi:hypothetical protein WA538_005766 [Blastocystis sp. DL]
MSSYPRIVVLSIPKSGKSTLFQGLSRYFEFDYKKKPEREEILGSRIVSIYEVDVFTKYYFAHIELCFVSGNNATLTSEELKTLISDNCQGVIFVCRSMDTSALDVIKKWNTATIEKSDSMELRLVVCSFGDIQNPTAEKNLKAIKAWCIDNFYEMIPANLRVPHHSWKSQDKEGVARVVEDMECVMWSNMDTSKRRTTERVIEESVIINKDEQDTCAFCHKSKSANSIPLYLCSRCRTVSYCSRDCQVKDWKNHKTFCVGLSPADDAEPGLGTGPHCEGEGGGGEAREGGGGVDVDVDSAAA